jgi:glycosyltransferase involved in cell wall biosynthesis
MNTAIIHNFLDNIGGAETVALTLASELEADLITTNYDLEKIKKRGFENIKIKSVGKIPLNAPFRQQAALFRLKRKIPGYDLYIIAGDWAISAAACNKPNLEYFHSPLNEIWEFNKHIRNKWLPPWKRPIFDAWTLHNRRLYRKYFKHVQKKIANSKNTKNRIKKYLNSEAEVVYPPTYTNNFRFRKFGDYWLSVNRLFEHKRVHMQIEAFKKIPEEKLIIVGSYEKSSHFLKYASYLKKIKPDNVEIRSWISQEELTDLYSKCRGFITTAMDEDFGITPVEAMASGKAVIAPNEGGYKETVINGKTGILIDRINSDKIAEAVKKINVKKYKKACLERAKKFDTKEFIKKIKNEIKK